MAYGLHQFYALSSCRQEMKVSSGDSRDSFSRSQAHRRLKAGDLLNSLRQRKMDSKPGDAVRAAVCRMRIAGSFHPWLARHSRMIKREDLMIELQPCLHPAAPQQQLSLVRQTNPRAFYMIISVGRSVASPAQLTSRSSVSKHSQPLSLIIVGSLRGLVSCRSFPPSSSATTLTHQQCQRHQLPTQPGQNTTSLYRNSVEPQTEKVRNVCSGNSSLETLGGIKNASKLPARFSLMEAISMLKQREGLKVPKLALR